MFSTIQRAYGDRGSRRRMHSTVGFSNLRIGHTDVKPASTEAVPTSIIPIRKLHKSKGECSTQFFEFAGDYPYPAEASYASTKKQGEC